MIILITGASHTGKTLLAQKMLKKYNYPYLSIDHLKMGGKPGGHMKWSAICNRMLDEMYGREMAALGIADTIIAVLEH